MVQLRAESVVSHNRFIQLPFNLGMQEALLCRIKPCQAIDVSMQRRPR